jgi:mRNA interferase RelE/StbE
MLYRILVARSAARRLRAVPETDRRRIAKRIDALAEEPRPPGVRKLQGANDLYRIRVGDYRVIYSIADAVLTVLVIRVGHRRDIYR